MQEYPKNPFVKEVPSHLFRFEEKIFGMTLASGFAISIGLFAGMYPSLTASRLQPVEALRS